VKLQRWSRPPWIAVIRWRLLLLLMAEREMASATDRSSERASERRATNTEQGRKKERKKRRDVGTRCAQLRFLRSVVASMLSKTCCVSDAYPSIPRTLSIWTVEENGGWVVGTYK